MLEPKTHAGSLDFDDHITVIKVPDVTEDDSKSIDLSAILTKQRSQQNFNQTPQFDIKLSQELIDACQIFNVKEITKLCKNVRVNVNYQRAENGMTALMVLLSTTNWGDGELDERTANKILQIMTVILKNNQMDIDICDNHGKTAFYYACELGNPSILRKLIEFGCNIVDNKLNEIINNIFVKNGNYQALLMLIQLFPIEYYCDTLINNTLNCQHCNKVLKSFRNVENINNIESKLSIDVTAKEFDEKLKDSTYFEEYFDENTNYFIKNGLFIEHDADNMYDLQLKLNIKFNNNKKQIVSYIHNKLLQNTTCLKIYHMQYDWLNHHLSKYDKNSHNYKRIDQFIKQLNENIDNKNDIGNDNSTNDEKKQEMTNESMRNRILIKNGSKLRNFQCLFGKQEINLTECHCIYFCDSCLYYNHNLQNPYICNSCTKYIGLLRYCMAIHDTHLKKRTNSQAWDYAMKKHKKSKNRDNNNDDSLSSVALIMTKTLYGNTNESRLNHYLSMSDWNEIAWDDNTLETSEQHVKWCLKLRNMRIQECSNVLRNATRLSDLEISIIVWFLFGIKSFSNGCQLMLKNVNYD